MDPIKNLLDYLQNNFADRLPQDGVAAIERTTRELFAKFELVPKHEFEAQVQILTSLQQQVADLEQRLAELEQTV
jgi:BMFP domain-containing protein YqiC